MFQVMDFGALLRRYQVQSIASLLRGVRTILMMLQIREHVKSLHLLK